MSSKKSEIDTVLWIHRGLTRSTKNLPAQHAGALNIVIGVFKVEGKFR